MPASCASWAMRSAWFAPCLPVTAQKPADMPAEWAQTVEAGDEADRPRRIADFIAGMTDRYALIEHGRLFDSTPELR